MAQITLDIYSGRPNPTIEVRNDRLDALLDSASRIETEAQVGTGLGFRGLILPTAAPSNARYAEFARDEDALYIPSALVPAEFVSVLLESDEEELRFAGQALLTSLLQSSSFRFSSIHPIPPTPVTVVCPSAPPYDPGNWNFNPALGNNNCYNYACRTRTDTFAQPGRATGNQAPFPPTCSGVTSGALSDGLVKVPAGTCQANGHVVALVIANQPGFLDYHWYRMGSDGMWSHKPGGTPVTNLDNSNQPIADPLFADRGPYTQFCGYMRVGPGAININ